MNKKRNVVFLLLFSLIFIYGWGSTGHKLINRRSTYSLPPSMSFLNWPDSLAAHSSDADIRRNTDPNEAPRHFIDIDDYPEFIATGRIPQDLDSLIALHGSSFVYATGILPFSIMATVDSVKKYFQLHNFQKAMLKAADLGHYVGDGHNPLHITRNYDGQYTNQSGVHSRYETQMINRDSAFITYTFENAVYVSNINQFAFNFLYDNYRYVDSVLKYDSIAHAISQNYSTQYYQIYWELAGSFTIKLFNNASHFLGSLIYTAWVNAGSPVSVTPSETSLPEKYFLEQNYPNPFNPETKISYDLPSAQFITLYIYDMSGREITKLVNEIQTAGRYEIKFNTGNLSSGIYYLKMNAGTFTEVKKMAVTK